jgi:hypothetical protein
MNAIWFYFTFAENLGIATGQQTHEFPVLAAKLWGDFAAPFWIMIGLMAIAFWVLVIPLVTPKSAKRIFLFRPLTSIILAIAALAIILLMFVLPATPVTSTILWILLIVSIICVLFGVTLWLKENLVAATLIAGVFVVIGMWLERWNIVVGTTTHPMLIAYVTYVPSLTEISVTLASLSMFVLMFIIFFRIFPAISIWEVAEGRLVEQQATVNASHTPQAVTAPEAH